jgi:hypothetical protein
MAAGSGCAQGQADLVGRERYAYHEAYSLVWEEDFSDADVARFSESGTVRGSMGGKAWRARYHWGEGDIGSRRLAGGAHLYTNADYLGIVPFSIANGYLRITQDLIPKSTLHVPTDTFAEPPASYRIYSGLIQSAPTQKWTYGIFEARMRFVTAPGVSHAFWLYSTDDVEPLKREIDIVEAIGDLPNTVAVSIHGQAVRTSTTYVEDYDIRQWHTYAVKWEPGRVRWYIDGNLVKDFTGADSFNGTQLYIIIDMGANTKHWNTEFGPPKAEDLPAFQDIEYVRVWQAP